MRAACTRAWQRGQVRAPLASGAPQEAQFAGVAEEEPYCIGDGRLKSGFPLGLVDKSTE